MKFCKFSSVLTVFFSFAVSAQDPVQSFNRAKPEGGEKRGAPVVSVDKGRQVAKPTIGASRQDEVKVLVRGFRFQGGDAITMEEMLAHADVRLNSYYTFAELLVVADRLTAYLRGLGYLVAKVELPAQTIENDEVVFTVYKGRLSKGQPYTVSGASDAETPVVGAVLQSALCAGQACGDKGLMESDMHRALALVQEVAGVRVKEANLDPGAEEGSTSLQLVATPAKPYILEAYADNFGSQAIGVNQFSTRMGGNSVFAPGDVLALTYGETNLRNMSAYSLSYGAALGVQGWRAGASLARGQYNISSVGLAGKSDVVSTYVAYPLTRLPDRTSDFQLDLEGASLSSEGSVVSDRKLNTGRLGFSATQRSAVDGWGRAVSEWYVGLAALRLTDASDTTNDASGVAGNRSKLSWRYRRIQQINDAGYGWFTGVTTYGQTSNKNLDPYAKLSLGGANAVRAYAAAEKSGDEAVIAQLSLGYWWPTKLNDKDYTVNLTSFYDSGWARLQKDNISNVSGNCVTLRGYGFEMQIASPEFMTLRTFVARGLSGASGVDGKTTRLGLSASFSY